MTERKRAKPAVWEEPPKNIKGGTPFLIIMNIHPIIVGTEMEYGIPEHPPVKRDMILSNLPEGLVNIGEFLSNGSRFYIDSHHKVEYSTPECLTVDDVVHAEFSGEKIVFYALSTLMAKGTIKSYPIRKCVIDDGGRTWGYHENYLISRRLYDSQKHLPFLMGHFATQCVLTGAGRIVEADDDCTIVQPAQKMHGISQIMGSSSTTSKALLNQRDSPHCDAKKWARQHVVCNDANLTVLISSLKIGSTKLVLRLGEFSDRFDFIEMQNIRPKKALGCAQRIASDSNGTATLTVQNGKTMSALNLQEELLHQAALLEKEVELPADERAALELWQDLHDTAKHYPDLADKVIEHRAKRAFVEQYTEHLHQRNRTLSRDDIIKINHAWDNIDPKLGIGRRWLASADEGMIDADYIDHLVKSPPEGTRAYDRGKFIQQYVRGGTGPVYTRAEMNWEAGKIGEIVAEFKNPFGYGSNNLNTSAGIAH